MSTKIQIRRDVSTNWTNSNPVLAQGEPGLETDTGKLKYGDGATAWNSLSYSALGYTGSSGVGYVGSMGSTGTGYTGSAGTIFNQSLTPAQLASQTNNYTPVGYTPGVTNRLLLTPALGGSTITGLDSPGVDGFSMAIVNLGTTSSISFTHMSTASSAGNQFVCANSGTSTVSAFGGTTLIWINNLVGSTGYWVFR